MKINLITLYGSYEMRKKNFKSSKHAEIPATLRNPLMFKNLYEFLSQQQFQMFSTKVLTGATDFQTKQQVRVRNFKSQQKQNHTARKHAFLKKNVCAVSMMKLDFTLTKYKNRVCVMVVSADIPHFHVPFHSIKYEIVKVKELKTRYKGNNNKCKSSYHALFLCSRLNG